MFDVTICLASIAFEPEEIHKRFSSPISHFLSLILKKGVITSVHTEGKNGAILAIFSIDHTGGNEHYCSSVPQVAAVPAISLYAVVICQCSIINQLTSGVTGAVISNVTTMASAAI